MTDPSKTTYTKDKIINHLGNQFHGYKWTRYESSKNFGHKGFTRDDVIQAILNGHSAYVRTQHLPTKSRIDAGADVTFQRKSTVPFGVAIVQKDGVKVETPETESVNGTTAFLTFDEFAKAEDLLKPGYQEELPMKESFDWSVIEVAKDGRNFRIIKEGLSKDQAILMKSHLTEAVDGNTQIVSKDELRSFRKLLKHGVPLNENNIGEDSVHANRLQKLVSVVDTIEEISSDFVETVGNWDWTLNVATIQADFDAGGGNQAGWEQSEIVVTFEPESSTITEIEVNGVDMTEQILENLES